MNKQFFQSHSEHSSNYVFHATVQEVLAISAAIVIKISIFASLIGLCLFLLEVYPIYPLIMMQLFELRVIILFDDH